jgi:hypothetical protein
MAAGPTARCGRRTWRRLLKLCCEQELRTELLQSLAVMKRISNVGVWLVWLCRKLELGAA